MYIPRHRLYARYLPVGGQLVDKWCISDGLDNGPVANVNVASLIRKGTKFLEQCTIVDSNVAQLIVAAYY